MDNQIWMTMQLHYSILYACTYRTDKFGSPTGLTNLALRG